MKILVACEESQAVTIELRKLGQETATAFHITVLGLAKLPNTKLH
jgi:hypothetical protein